MKTLGIIGGMGPEATGDVFTRLIKLVPAKKDGDHPNVVVLSYPGTPDRTEAILGAGPSPVKDIVKMGKRMEKLNVHKAIIACITAHYFYDEIQSAVSIPILNALEETANFINDKFKCLQKIGILSTTGTVKTRIFERYFSDKKIVYPDDDIQVSIMKAIYSDKGLKSDYNGDYSKNILSNAAQHLIDKGSDVLIAGCTEIPLVLTKRYKNVPIINPMDIVLKKLVNFTY